MRRHLLFTILLGLLGAVATCAEKPMDESVDERSCEQLRDHLVDIHVSDIGVGTGVDREAHRAALTRALGDGFISSCITKLSASQAECANAATDAAAVAACTTNQRSEP